MNHAKKDNCMHHAKKDNKERQLYASTLGLENEHDLGRSHNLQFKYRVKIKDMSWHFRTPKSFQVNDQGQYYLKTKRKIDWKLCLVLVTVCA